MHVQEQRVDPARASGFTSAERDAQNASRVREWTRPDKHAQVRQTRREKEREGERTVRVATGQRASERDGETEGEVEKTRSVRFVRFPNRSPREPSAVVKRRREDGREDDRFDSSIANTGSGSPAPLRTVARRYYKSYAIPGSGGERNRNVTE